MLKKNYLFILIIILIIVNLLLLIENKNLHNSKSSTLGDDKSNNLSDKTYINLLRGRILMQAKYNAISIDNNAIVMDTLGKNIELKNIVTSGENIVFFFTKDHCYSCIDGAMPYLESLAGKIGYDKIFLLADLNEKRDILTFKAKYNSKLRIYSISDSSVHCDAKNLNYPFLFLINKQGSGHSIFFVERDLPEVTGDFIQEMTLYFKKDKL